MTDEKERLIELLEKYELKEWELGLQKHGPGNPAYEKHTFFTEIIELLKNNELSVSILTNKLATLNDDQRSGIFGSEGIGKEARQIEALYRFFNVILTPKELRSLIEEKPSDFLQAQLRDKPYKMWQRSPFHPYVIGILEQELKVELGIKDIGSLVNILITNPPGEDSVKKLLNRAPAYVPQLLAQVYQGLSDEKKLNFIQSLLTSKDKLIIEALLHSSPEIVAEMVVQNPEYYFRTSESMRISIQSLLPESTSNRVKQVVDGVFSGEANSQYRNMLLDGSYRYEAVRLSQRKEALIEINQYLALKPGKYKARFFYKLGEEIKTEGLTVGLLQKHLNNEKHKEELFVKWYGAKHSRAAGLMAKLYKIASSGTELNSSQMGNLTSEGELPKVPYSIEGKPEQSNEPSWLQDKVEEAIKDDVTDLIVQEQKHQALKIIQRYLEQTPGQYKAEFFKELANLIAKKGLTIELLQDHLDSSPVRQNLLFEKWSGRSQSRAAQVMADLYQCATLGKSLNSDELNQMVSDEGKLPDIRVNESEKREFILNKIQEVISNPGRINTSPLSQRIDSAIEALKAKARMICDEQHKDSLRLEALYQKMLIEKGIEIASQQEKPTFDTQGRVLVFVSLSEEEFQSILDQGNLKKAEGKTAEETIKSLLPTKITKPTLCNLDIKSIKILEAKFKEWLGDGNDAAFEFLIHSEERATIIDLQEEMLMHVSLSLRTMKKILSLNFPETKDLLPGLNTIVQDAYKKALKNALNKDNSINFNVLNAELDRVRETRSAMCRCHLVQELARLNPGKDLSKLMESVKNSDFTSTTATGLDYLRSDVRNQCVVRISATERTAHQKEIGSSTQAIRVIHRNVYIADKNWVIPYPDPTLEARVPSIAVKEENTSVGVNDVANKLRESHQLLRRQATHTGGPLVYNLLTSLHTVVYDNFFFERPNRQRLSAEYILKGAHLYNLGQLRLGESRELVYVQNIPVNQHTNQLDDEAFDDVTKEATLMTDIAMLSTLSHYAGYFPSSVQQSIDSAYEMAHSHYLSFLPSTEQGKAYFHKSREGALVNSTLSHLKNQWGRPKVPLVDREPLDKIVIKALFKIYASNEHRNKQFGMLVQSLSVFVEPMSQAGCKSANERYQGVSGRVELLKSITSRPESTHSTEEKAVVTSLQDLVEGKGTCAQVQKALDEAYNKHNLYGAATAISKEDQGAASKVEATKNEEPGVITERDTNVAETGFLTRLYQSCSSKMQAHIAKLADDYKLLFGIEAKQLQREQRQLEQEQSQHSSPSRGTSP